MTTDFMESFFKITPWETFKLWVGVIFILLSVIFIPIGGYFTYQYYFTKKIESKKIIAPEIKLTVKDNKIDTVYVYKFK